MQHDHIMMSSNPDFVLVENEADQVARRAVQALKLSRARCRQASALGVPTWTGQNGAAGAPTTQSARPRFGQKRNPAFQINVAKSNKAASTTATSEMTSCSVDSGVGFDGAALLRSNPEVHSKPLLSSSELLTRIMARSELPEPPVSDNLDETPEPTSANQSLLHPMPSGDELQLLTEIRNFIACEAATDGQATTVELLEKFKSNLPHSKSAVFKAMLKQISEFYRENGSGIWRLKPEFR